MKLAVLFLVTFVATPSNQQQQYQNNFLWNWPYNSIASERDDYNPYLMSLMRPYFRSPMPNFYSSRWSMMQPYQRPQYYPQQKVQ